MLRVFIVAWLLTTICLQPIPSRF